MTYSDVFRLPAKKHVALFDVASIVFASLTLAISAQIAVRLPLSPIPVTAQTLAVLLVGACLGSRRGALAVLAYLAEGIAGLPVFAGGMTGLAYLLGPTGGYLAGFVAAAYLTGLLAERGWDRRPTTALLAMLAGNAAIYVFGLVWLAAFIGTQNVLPAGLYPFIPGDMLKLAVATTLLPTGWRVLGFPRE